MQDGLINGNRRLGVTCEPNLAMNEVVLFPLGALSKKHMGNSCFVCGEPGGVVAGTRLPQSRKSAAEFLLEFNVLSSRNDSVTYDDGSLCGPCFSIVLSCDQWYHKLTDGVERLRTRGAWFAARKGVDSVEVKMECDDFEVEVRAPTFYVYGGIRTEGCDYYRIDT